MNHSDDTVMGYLFGELAESQRAEMEAEYFDDPLAFDRLERFENDLIDKYARGRLEGETRARFERAYLSNPNRRARLEFAEALAARIDQYEPSLVRDAVSGRPRRRFFASLRPAFAFSMATVFGLLVFASVWLLIESRRLRTELAGRDAAQARQEQHEAELQRQLEEEQKRNQELAAELERASDSATAQTKPSPESPAFVTLLLAASGVRGAETASPPTLVIPKGTEQVRVQVTLKDNDYLSYQIVVRAIAGPEIFTGQNFKPRINKSGAVFSLSFAASKLTTGDYMLTLRGALQGGVFEDVSKSLFRVEKK